MELLRVMVIQILQQLHFFMELEKTCSCYIPSTTILLSVTDVGGVGEDLATMGQRGEDYADLHAWARTHAAGHGDGFAMTRQQHSPMLGLVPPLIFATICWSAHVFANNNFCWAAHFFGKNPAPCKVMSRQGLQRVGMISENIMGSTSSRSPASWTICCQHHHHDHPIPNKQ